MSSPDHAYILYCIAEITRPDCATRKAGAHSVGLLSVHYSTLAGVSVALLVRPALSPLRDENLCIIRSPENLSAPGGRVNGLSTDFGQVI